MILAPSSRAWAANSAKYSGRRVRVDDAAAGEAREADVRQRCERPPVAAHLLERRERGEQAGAVVRADRGDVELARAGRPPRAR